MASSGPTRRFSRSQAEALSRDPAAPPEALAQLARNRRAEIRRAVAENPNTPRDALLALADHFPDEVLGNPTLALLLLEDPALFEKLPTRGALRMLEAEEPPPGAIAAAARHTASEVRLAAVRHPRCTPEILAEIERRPGNLSDVCAAIARAPQTPPETLARLAKDTSSFVRSLVAEHPATPPEVVGQLAVDGDTYVRAAAVRSRRIPPDVVTLLRRGGAADDLQGSLVALPRLAPEDAAALAAGGAFARYLAAQNPSTPPPTLAALAADKDYGVRGAVARNPSTPRETLAAMAADATVEIRIAVTQNPGADAATLISLARDGASPVRWWVARSPVAPPEALELLARDYYDELRASVAENPRTPRHVLEALAEDPVPEVQKQARARLSRPGATGG